MHATYLAHPKEPLSAHTQDAPPNDISTQNKYTMNPHNNMQLYTNK